MARQSETMTRTSPFLCRYPLLGCLVMVAPLLVSGSKSTIYRSECVSHLWGDSRHASSPLPTCTCNHHPSRTPSPIREWGQSQILAPYNSLLASTYCSFVRDLGRS